jgi:hypothetical protein
MVCKVGLIDPVVLFPRSQTQMNAMIRRSRPIAKS